MATTNVMILASRFYSSLAKHQLAALRKKTGFPLGKCKEALTANNNDLEIAEKWLDSQAQAEGWAKVEKLRDRTANQGLIGLLIRGNRGAMVEVNCETDFVAKNEKFQSLVSTVTQALFDYEPGHKTPKPVCLPVTHFPSFSVEVFTQECLSQLRTAPLRPPGSPLEAIGPAIASAVGCLGENLMLQRGCLMSSGGEKREGIVCGFVYNNLSATPDLAMGKYATLLHLSPVNKPFADIEAIGKLGCDIGQHIVGFNPIVVNEGERGISDPTEVLTKQGFVLDDSVSVGDVLARHDARVTKFVRYALGETSHASAEQLLDNIK